MSVGAIGSVGGSISRSAQAAQQTANPFGKMLASATGAAATAAPTSAAQQQYTQSLNSLQKTLAGLFSAAGIDTSESISIEQSPEGNLSVNSGHPEASEIEQVLSAHPELVAQFKAVAANLYAAQQSAGVQNLPTPSAATFTLTLQGNQANGTIQ